MKRSKRVDIGILLATALAASLSIIVLQRVDQAAERVATRAVASLESPSLLGQMPASRIQELLQVEDPSFYDHAGVDFGTPGQGWTTITQGVVKRYFSGPLAGVWGKSRQSLFALALNRHLTKDQQLQVFLEVAYFGMANDQEVIGFPEASRVYFGKPLQDLTRREFLGLVAMLVGPNQFNPVSRSEHHRERLARIEAMLAGRCEPLSWRDVYLEGCDGGE